MPYYGSGIPQQNTALLRGAAVFPRALRENALNTIKLKQGIDDAERKKKSAVREEKMKMLYIIGRALDNATDDPSYRQAKNFISRIYGPESVKDMPEKYDRNFVDKQKVQTNILFDLLGKGNENPKLYPTEEGWQTASNAIGKKKPSTPKAYRPMTREQSIADFEEKEKIKSKYKDSKDETAKQASLYTKSMSQILQEYGASGTGFNIDQSTGQMSFTSGGQKAYQDMSDKAKGGDSRARQNLVTYENLKQKLLGLSGEGQASGSSNIPSWKKWYKK